MCKEKKWNEVKWINIGTREWMNEWWPSQKREKEWEKTPKKSIINWAEKREKNWTKAKSEKINKKKKNNQNENEKEKEKSKKCIQTVY